MYRKKRSKTSVRTDSPRNVPSAPLEILKNKIEIKDTKATIKSSNKIRAKLYEFKGSWVVDSYLILEKENNKWITKEILI